MVAAPTPITANQDLGRQFFQSQDRRCGGPDPSLCDAGYRAKIGEYPEMDIAGHDGFAMGFYAGFPDVHHQIDDVVADDSQVVVRFRLHGTHTGSFFGIPATGKTMSVSAIAILKIESGQVTKVDAVFDEAGLLRQIGVLPSS